MTLKLKKLFDDKFFKTSNPKQKDFNQYSLISFLTDLSPDKFR